MLPSMKTLLFSLSFISLFTTHLLCKENYGSVTISELVSVYDGDTLKVNIKEYPTILGEKISVRVNGIDTPEIKGKCLQEKELAQKAKKVATYMLKNATVIELRNMQRGKYFRIVADVYANGVSLSEKLIEKKLAVPYDGGTKTKNWCE
jgi:micrococcal nuclease